MNQLFLFFICLFTTFNFYSKFYTFRHQCNNKNPNNSPPFTCIFLFISIKRRSAPTPKRLMGDLVITVVLE